MSIRRKLTIMFLAMALLPLLFVSDLTYINYKKSLEANRLSQLQDLTIFRADRIESYFSGIKSHIEIAQGFYNIKKNLPILTRLADDSNNPQFIAAKKMLDGQLQQMQSVSDLSDIMLINPQGKVVYANRPEHFAKDMSNGYDAEQKAFGQGKDRIYFSDVYFDKAEDNRYEILLTAPASDFNGVFIGVIAFEIDMTPLYKLIQDRTGLGQTGEVLVGRKIGNQVEFLNPLRHEPNTVMKRINIGDKFGGPIQQAVQGKNGVGRSIDYRGKNVIAAWRYIPSLDWGMVAKIDTAEAFADVTNLRNLSIIIMVIIFVLAGIVAFSIARSISEPIKRLSESAKIVGSGNLDVQLATNLKDEIGQLSRTFDKMTRDLKLTTASRDELNREITEREKKEEELVRLNRTLRAIGNSNQAMMHAKDESQFLKEVCDIIIKDCGHEMAWIGFAGDDENKTVRPAASAGFEDGYLDTLNITWADTQRGHGPTGTAIRTGKISMCRNMLTDPAFEPWRAEAIKRGYASSAVFPLIFGDKTFGALSIYSREPDPFSQDEINLLTELADDLSYGLATIRARIERDRAEEAVKASEVRYRRLFEATRDGILILDADSGQLVDVNPFIKEMLGYSHKELLGKKIWEIGIFKNIAASKEAFLDLQNKGYVRYENLPLETKDGRRISVEFVSNVYLVDQKKLIQCNIRDMTARVLAEEAVKVSEVRYRRLFEATRDGILILDADSGQLVDVNPFIKEMLGYSHEELLGKKIWEIGIFKNIAASKESFLELQNKGYVRFENMPLETKDGHRISVEFVSNVYLVDQKKLIQCNIRDITDRVRAEEGLKNLAKELARSNKDLEQFAYVASHDLQEPLRMIAGYTQLLQRRYKDKLDEDANQFIYYTVDGVMRMQSLINDLLAYSRLNTGSEALKFVDCREVLDEVLAALQMTIEESGAAIKLGPMPNIRADKGQLFQLFQNLISNAIKFRGDEPLLINITAKPQDKQWLFSVSDNGIGMEPQYLERIFIIFQRLHTQDKYAGTGIGLAICKKIVERHGGRIWVESMPGKGSTFYFII